MKMKDINFNSWLGLFMATCGVIFFFINQRLPYTLVQMLAMATFGLYMFQLSIKDKKEE